MTVLETIPSQQIYLELASVKTQQEKLRFLAGLNVGYVLATHNIESPLLALDSTFPVNSPEPLRVYRLSNPLPRVFLTDSQGQADRQLSFQEQLSVEGGTENQRNPTRERAQVVSYRPNQVDIETESPRSRLLVLLDSYYPGWKATIDGTAVPVVAANFVYRAIELPQGRHRVAFRYESQPFTRGAWISGSASPGMGRRLCSSSIPQIHEGSSTPGIETSWVVYSETARSTGCATSASPYCWPRLLCLRNPLT